MAARNIFSICKNPYFLDFYLYVLELKCVEQDTDFLHQKQDRYGLTAKNKSFIFIKIFNETYKFIKNKYQHYLNKLRFF